MFLETSTREKPIAQTAPLEGVFTTIQTETSKTMDLQDYFQNCRGELTQQGLVGQA